MSSDFPETLRRAREGRRLSLDDVARRAGVPLADIVALERGDLAAFEARVHAKASLRSVAKALDLDAEALLLAIDRLWPPDAQPPSVAPRTAAPLVPPPPAAHPVARRPERPRRRARWALGMALAALAVAAAAWAMTRAAADAGADTALDLGTLADEPALKSAAPGERAGDRDLPGTIVAGGPIATMAASPADTPVQVLDASGEAAVLQAAVEELSRLGYDILSTDKARDVRARSVVYYNDGWEGEARLLTDTQPRFGAVLVNDRGLDPDLALHIVVGQDWRDGSA